VKATVAVCTRDRSELLAQALASIRISTGAVPDVEVVIVEQGLTTAKDACREVGLDAEIIHDRGVGAARARNVAIRQAHGEILLFTDDDCEVPETWVGDHLRVLDDPLLAGSFGPVSGLSRFSGSDQTEVPAYRQHGAFPWEVGHSANMAARRDVLIAIAGFDERLGPGAPHGVIGEDADLIVRLLASGVTLRSGVGAPVRHMEWRSDVEDRVNLRRYERGAGAWIGKALRVHPLSASRALRTRLGLQRDRFRDLPRDRWSLMLNMADFWWGVYLGLTMGPWREPIGPTAHV
jgi:glycosyltransferase involved in cell wall biosynthesis